MNPLKILNYVRCGGGYGRHYFRLPSNPTYALHPVSNFYPDHILLVSVLSTLVPLLLLGLLWYLIFLFTAKPNKVELIEYTLPNWWGPYLLHGEFSGYTSDELKSMDEFLERENIRFVQVDDENFYSDRNDIYDKPEVCSIFLAIKK